MREKLKEIGRPFSGNAGLTAAWIGITAVLFCTALFLPVFIGGAVSSIAKSQSVTDFMAKLAIVWMLAVMIGSHADTRGGYPLDQERGEEKRRAESAE